MSDPVVGVMNSITIGIKGIVGLAILRIDPGNQVQRVRFTIPSECGVHRGGVGGAGGTLVAGSFVDDELRPYFSDVLYSLKTKGGYEGYVHVLIEHQSSPDRHMAFRLMRYAVATMQRHLDSGHKRLPLVIPVLFYSGKRSPYPYTTRWLDEFDDPALAKTLYCGEFPLVDVTVIPDDEIMGHRSMAALTLLQKHIHRRDVSELLDKLTLLLLTETLTREQVHSLISYLVQAGEAVDSVVFVRELAQRVPQHGDELMTIAQQLEQKGIEKGIKQGIEQGIEIGERRGIEKGEQRGIEKGIEKGEREATCSGLRGRVAVSPAKTDSHRRDRPGRNAPRR